MNKYQMIRIICSLCFILFIMTGCSNKTETGTKIDSDDDTSKSSGVLVCTRDTAENDNYTVDLDYQVTYKKGYITNIHSTEMVTSDDNDILNKFEEAYNNVFEVYKDLKYYDNDVSRNGNSVISETVIQYDKIDMDALEKAENSEYSIIKDGKVALNDWLSFAEKFGTKCIEK